MKKAIVYVRGYNKEMQEMICRVYAIDKGYKVIHATKDIEDVKDCDILLVVNNSRISREQSTFLNIVKDLEEKGIELISIASQNDANESISLAVELFKQV